MALIVAIITFNIIKVLSTVLWPLAQVQLEVEGQAMEVTVAVADKLSMSVLLGTDNSSAFRAIEWGAIKDQISAQN